MPVIIGNIICEIPTPFPTICDGLIVNVCPAVSQTQALLSTPSPLPLASPSSFRESVPLTSPFTEFNFYQCKILRVYGTMKSYQFCPFFKGGRLKEKFDFSVIM